MGGRGVEEQVEAEIPVEQMKRYISYCRRSVDLLADGDEVGRKLFCSFGRETGRTTTTREVSIQLEAIVRISESLAKLSLSPVATEAHVDEAIRLFLLADGDEVGRKLFCSFGRETGRTTTTRDVSMDIASVIDPHHRPSTRGHCPYFRVPCQTFSLPRRHRSPKAFLQLRARDGAHNDYTGC
jgi:DNA replicative helicase MCM subunit Mcm2 (Cdc46/Mcm family)